MNKTNWTAGVALVVLAIIAGVAASLAFYSWEKDLTGHAIETLPEPTSVPSVTEPAPTPGGNATVNKVPTVIPTSHTGRTACRVCHEAGLAGAPQFPADHAERTDAQCATCHRRG
jgi:cytochrome c5